MSEDMKDFANPIGENNPVGIDLKDDDHFKIIQNEINKQLEAKNWELVSKNSETILKEKSKHLLVIVYWSIAETQLNQFSGFFTSMKVINTLIEKFGKDLYPKKEKGKKNAFEYWIKNTRALLRIHKPVNISENQKEQMKNEVDQLKKLLNDIFTKDIPSLQKIEDVLNSIPVAAKEKESKKPVKTKEQKESEITETTVDEKKKSSSKQQNKEKQETEKKQKAEIEEMEDVDTDNLENDEDIKRVLNKILKNCENFASGLRQVDLKNRYSYYFNRLHSWGNVSDLPGINSGGNTDIPPPDPEEMNQLNQLEQSKNWTVLLERSESMLPYYKFNLNLNRYSVIAAKNLGSAYEDVVKTIEQETSFFLLRIPGIEKLTFNDASPFADQKTKKWLDQISLSEGGGSVQLEAEDANFHKTLQEIHNKGSYKDMIPLIQAQIKQAISYKNKHFWRSELINLLNKHAKYEFMVPHLEIILEEINTFNIEKWDQDYALKVYIWAVGCFQLISTEQAKKRVNDLHQRIIRLDLVNAMKLFAGPN